MTPKSYSINWPQGKSLKCTCNVIYYMRIYDIYLKTSFFGDSLLCMDSLWICFFYKNKCFDLILFFAGISYEVFEKKSLIVQI